ncbi:MAG TPA: asparaginase [Actinomycetota bacterium]
MSGPVVVEAIRSDFVESEHLVDVAVVDERGSLIASAGDPAREAAFRSSAKPLQAGVAREAGWAPADQQGLAIACASHSGEPGHIEAVRALLEAAGVTEDALACPEALPFRAEDVVAAGGPARIAHNCSGKHAAMLAACRAAGWPLEGYRAPEHPLQQRIAARMSSLLGAEPDVLVDGCGAPTFVAPLHALARAFASAAGTPEAAAMSAYPWLVGGTGRADTDLMRAAPGIVSKGGAEGLVCAAARGITVAIKARDGGARACPPALLFVLEQLSLLTPEAAAELSIHREPPVLGGGVPVGALRARGTLAFKDR